MDAPDQGFALAGTLDELKVKRMLVVHGSHRPIWLSMIAVARYLAAHSPTERAALQTADIAQRLMRVTDLHQEAPVS